MIKGHNSDITAWGKSYHVQTEDWGEQNPFIVTRVFCNGAVIKTIKTPYSQALKAGPVRQQEALSFALRHQHNQILDQLISGEEL